MKPVLPHITDSPEKISAEICIQIHTSMCFWLSVGVVEFRVDGEWPWAACVGCGHIRVLRTTAVHLISVHCFMRTLTDQTFRRPWKPTCLPLRVEPRRLPTVSFSGGHLATAVDCFHASCVGCARPSRLDRRHALATIVSDYRALHVREGIREIGVVRVQVGFLTA